MIRRKSQAQIASNLTSKENPSIMAPKQKTTRRLATAIATASIALLGLVPTAHAAVPYGIANFDAQANADESGATVFTQAAGHPYDVSTEIKLNVTTEAEPDPLNGAAWPAEPAKDILVDTPPGLVGNPTVAAQCTMDQIARPDGKPACPSASQVGVTTIDLQVPGSGEVATLPAASVYNMVPPPNVPARFAFSTFGTIVTLDATVRSDGDYGLTAGSIDTNQGLPVDGTDLTFWGVPASEAHTPERSCSGEAPAGQGGPTCPAGVPPQAFWRLASSCQGPQTVTLRTDSWYHPGDFKERSILSHEAPGLPDDPSPPFPGAPTYPGLAPQFWGAPVGNSGCADVPFEPAISVKPTTTQADSPSGLEVDLSVPQDQLLDPEAIAQADLKDARVTLPQGMSVNPSSVNGLGSCSAAQIGLSTPVGQSPVHFDKEKPSCPESSKLGTVQIDTPLLEAPLKGEVYLAAQGENPFSSLLALYIVAEGSGTIVKLAGQVEPSASGQLTTTFLNQPQVPFEALHLDLFAGSRAPLRTPRACGTHTTTATMTPWSGNAAVNLTSSFAISQGPGGGPCPSGFDPKLSAGTEVPLAGAYSPFDLRLSREDGSAELGGLAVTLPPGLAARFAGIPYCPPAALAAVSEGLGTATAQIASPSCPAASQVGTVSAGAGAGPSPFYLNTGHAYLAGPYKGAPLSLAIITPAKAGPFDLGSVLVRSALYVDPTTAQGTAVSDPLPSALHGIALDLRDVRVRLDRPDFTLNPTSCDPMAIAARITSTEGQAVARSDRFQVANCASLAFKPRLGFRLRGKTRRGGHPSFTATLAAKPGEANIASASVTLPRSEILDQGHIKTICTRVQYAAHACPPGSIYGYAKAWSPLLEAPLQGPVYLRSNGGERNLPDLVASLDGQFHIDLQGFIDAKGGRIRNRFELVPDAPVSRFVLTMKGGGKGLLVNSTDICAKRNSATVKLDGHNGKAHDTSPALKARCGGKHRKGAHRR